MSRLLWKALIERCRAAKRSVELIAFMHTQAFSTAVRVKGVVYGDRQAMLEADFVGTHVGAFEGIPASHRNVRVPYAVAYDVEDPGIKALRLYFPMDQLLRQIGAGEAVAAGARS